jgi:hypothetical protein
MNLSRRANSIFKRLSLGDRSRYGPTRGPSRIASSPPDPRLADANSSISDMPTPRAAEIFIAVEAVGFREPLSIAETVLGLTDAS